MNTIGKAAGSFVIAAMGLGLCGCETKAQTGALAGGAGGAALGAGIGSMSHARAGEGALIGGAIGAIGGYFVGNEMDKSDQRERDRAYERSTRSTRESRYSDSSSREARVTKQDVMNWTSNGVKDEVIIDRIERSGTTFRLSAADENQLRDAGVGEEVIRTMKYSNRR